MSSLVIEDLRAEVAGKEVLRGIDIEVHSGEVHAVMGPNGAGKSTLGNVLMGHPRYKVLGGSVRIDGVELLGLPCFERARAGLFLAPQDPTEVPGVGIEELLAEALGFFGQSTPPGDGELEELLAAEAKSIGLDPRFLGRALNVDASGGEKKRIETLQLAVLRPKFAVLDELDSGLDVDAVREVARRVEAATHGHLAASARKQSTTVPTLGVLAITHYRRLLEHLHADMVHVLVDGKIVSRGGPELAEELESSGYEGIAG